MEKMYSQEFFVGKSPMEIRAILVDNADSSFAGEYSRPLSEEEIADIKESFVQDNMLLAKEEDSFKREKELHKETIKPIIARLYEQRSMLRAGAEIKDGIIYSIKNHESGMIENYSEDGRFVGERRMLPNERSHSIKLTHSSNL